MGAYSVISRPSMVNGQPEDISVVLSNFDAIASVVNALDDSNIAPTANIQLSKLASGGSMGGVGLSGGGVNASAASVIAGVNFPGSGEVDAASVYAGKGITDQSVSLHDGAIHFNAPEDNQQKLYGFGPGVGVASPGTLTGSSQGITRVTIGQIDNIPPGGVSAPGISFGSQTYPVATLYNSGGIVCSTGGFSVGGALTASTLNTTGAISASRLAGRTGADLTVASGVITVTGNVHRVVGGNNITTINGGVDGMYLLLINLTGGVLNLASGGNINMPSSPQPVGSNAGRTLAYDGVANRWQYVG